MLALLLVCGHVMAQVEFTKYFEDNKGTLKVTIPTETARLVGWLQHSEEVLQNFNFETIGTDTITPAQACLAFRINPTFFPYSNSMNIDFDIKMESGFSWHNVGKYHFDMGAEEPSKTINDPNNCGVVLHYMKNPYDTPDKRGEEMMNPVIHFYPNGMYMWQRSKDNDSYEQLTIRAVVTFEKLDLGLPFTFEPWTVEIERKYVLKYEDPKSIRIDTKEMGEMILPRYEPQSSAWKDNILHYGNNDHIHMAPNPLLLYGNGDRLEKNGLINDTIMLPYPQDGNMYSVMTIDDRSGIFFEEDGKRIDLPGYERKIDVPDSLNFARLHQVTSSSSSFDQNSSMVTLEWQHDGRSPREDCKFYVYRLMMDAGKPDPISRYTKGNWKYLGNVAANKKDPTFKDNHGILFNASYVYAIVTIPGVWLKDGSKFNPETDLNLLPDYCPCTLLEVRTDPQVDYTMPLTQDSNQTDNITLKWQCSKVPEGGNQLKFDVYRRTKGEESWKRINQVDVTNNGKAIGTYTDTDGLQSCTVYEYKVSTHVKDGSWNLDNTWESEVLSASLLKRSHITEVSTTKGDQQNSVVVSWTAKLVGNDDVTYYVDRRLANSNNPDDYVTIYIVKGHATNYRYEDKNAESGQYYEYRVSAYTRNCDSDDDEIVLSNEMVQIGFGLNRGSISGNITFGSAGAAVEGVRLVLSTRGNGEEERIPSHAQYVTGVSEGIYWDVSARQTAALIGSEHPFTLQLLVHPSTNCQQAPVVCIPGLGDLTVTKIAGEEAFRLALCGKEFPTTIPAHRYSQLTLCVRKEMATLILDGQTSQPYSLTLDGHTWSAEHPLDGASTLLSLGGRTDLDEAAAFEGGLREFRLWTKELTDREIGQTYDRVLSGRERDLVIYWPMDEGTQSYVFDFSNRSGVSNHRHATVGANVLATDRQDLQPTADQVQIYGITDVNGQYTVRGIPFTGTGITYTVTPQMELHEFSPASRNGFISNQSLVLNNYDFIDRSSFEYTGIVSYLNTDIPVDSVTFSIDGISVMRDNNAVMTDRQGKFAIDVPIGDHYIEASASGHETIRFPKTGTYCFTKGGVLNFEDPTLVNVAGRINGGVSDAGAPLGFGLSTNRIGPATITLKLETQANNRFNLDADGNHRMKQTPINSMDNRIISENYYPGDDATKIVIHTNPKTGEFSAMLPPLRYVIESITFGGNSPYNKVDFFKQNLPAVDARSFAHLQVDTMTVDGQKESYDVQSRTILYYRSEPEMTVQQRFSNRDACFDAYGEYLYISEDDEEYPLFSVYTEDDEKNNPAHKEDYLESYELGYPIFIEGQKYTMLVSVTENYNYYDKKGDFEKEYKEVPTDGQVLISNQMSNRNTLKAQITDSVMADNKGSLVQAPVSRDGKLLYSFVCGKPNFATEDHTKTIVFSFNADGKVTLWKGAAPNPDGKGTLRGIVLGHQITGTNFVTKGPDDPIYVLRDPGGAGSSATYTRDTIRVDYDSHSRKFTTKESYKRTGKIGQMEKIKVGIIVAGEEVAVSTPIDFSDSYSAGEDIQRVNSYDEAKTITISNSEKFSTPNDYFHVGRSGDTYIGYSSNIYYGMGRTLYLKKNEKGELKLVNEEDLVADWNVSDSTMFIYPEYDIVNRTIPEMIKLRNELLEHVDSWEEVERLEINDGRVHYYTTLKEDDPRFGTSNDDPVWNSTPELAQQQDLQRGPSYMIKAAESLENYPDQISNFNTYINNWKNCIAANEDDKFDAIKGGRFENITFSGGNTITRTINLGDTVRMTPGCSDYKRMENVVVMSIKNQNKWKTKAFTMQSDFAFSEDLTFTQAESRHIEEKEQVSFTLADKNKCTGLSINVYQSPKGWGPIFITQGGQTATPWEGPTYCDYSTVNRGQPLDQATLKIENADLDVPKPVLTNVPNGDPAFFELKLTGLSEIQSPELYTLKLHPEDNLQGAVLAIDGSPITNTGITWRLFQNTITKTLKLVQTDLSVLDYNFRIRLESTTDPYNIYTKWFPMEAHFIPVSCPANLTVDTKVINAKRKGLNVTISDINTRYNGLNGVELRHRSEGDTDWTQDGIWVLESLLSEYPNAQSLPPTGRVDTELTFGSDGNYEVMARTFAKFDQQLLYRETDTIRVTQDRLAPCQLGSIEPVTGLLTLANRDDMCITFNEDINTVAISQQNNFVLQYEDPETLGLVKLDATQYDYTASDRQIAFSLDKAPLDKLNGQTLHVQLQKIPDLYGNESEKIDWKVACDFRSIAWPFDQDERTLSRNTDYRSVEIPLIPMASNHAYTIDCYLSVNGSWASCPKWLKLEGTSGITRLNDGYPTVRFTISQAAPAGEHYLKFVVKDDNNVTDSLIYKLTVEGEVPQWDVNPNDYDDNMTLVVNLFDGTQQIQDLSTLAAFDQDGNCCGVAQGGLATAYLVIYGNASEQKQIHFEYFDKQTGLTHSFLQFYYPGEDQAMQTHISFVAGSMIGTPGNSARLTFGDGYVQHLHLNKGWNWTSLYVEPSEPSVQAIFARYAKEIELIKWHDRFADVAEHVDGEISTCVNGPLATLPMQAGRLYKIKARQDVCVDIYSTNLLTTTGLQLTKGWNWMGCAGAQPMALSDLLPDAQMADFIKSNRSFAYRNERGEWEGALEAVMPGVGYCYYANAEAPQAYTYQPAPLRATEIDRAGYSENMTMVVRLTDGGKYLSGYDVEVIIDDTPRAYGTSDSLGLCYLTVLGNDADAELPLTLRIGEGSYVTEPEDLVFMSDAIYGTTIMPYLIDLHVDGINSLTGDADAPAVTYDLLGRRIEHPDKEKGFYIERARKSLIIH